MRENDITLIQRILDGDEGAFTVLVKKYQKWVHTLVWRKIGDFHTAEEITHRRRDHARYFLEGLQKLIDPKTPGEFSRMALCHRNAPLHDVAPKETATGDILGCDAHDRVRGIMLYAI